MKKLFTLLALISLAGIVLAAPPSWDTSPNADQAVVIQDQAAEDLNNTVDAVSTAGQVYPITIEDVFRLEVVGISKAGADPTNDSLWYNVGTSFYFGDTINTTADPLAGNDAGDDINGTNNDLPNDPSTYKNMLRHGSPYFNEHYIFLVQNRGLDFQLSCTVSGSILDIQTPGEGAVFPVETAFHTGATPDHWNDVNDSPMHMTVMQWTDPEGFSTQDVGALVSEDVPQAVIDGTAVQLYNSDAYTGISDGLALITALDFINIDAEAGTVPFVGTVTWDLIGS